MWAILCGPFASFAQFGAKQSSQKSKKPAIKRLQLFGSVESAQVAIERAKRKVPLLSNNLEQQTIGEAQLWLRPENIESRRHDIRVLQGQFLVIQKHLDRGAI